MKKYEAQMKCRWLVSVGDYDENLDYFLTRYCQDLYGDSLLYQFSRNTVIRNLLRDAPQIDLMTSNEVAYYSTDLELALDELRKRFWDYLYHGIIKTSSL